MPFHRRGIRLNGSGSDRIFQISEFASRGVYLVRATLDTLERDLDPRCFARIHRSAIVRLDLVREVMPNAHGGFEVVLEDDIRLPMSRTYRKRLLGGTGSGKPTGIPGENPQPGAESWVIVRRDTAFRRRISSL